MVSSQVNVMMGVGLLSLPFALKSSGWIGIGLLWLMGIVTNYTGVHVQKAAFGGSLTGSASARIVSSAPANMVHDWQSLLSQACHTLPDACFVIA